MMKMGKYLEKAKLRHMEVFTDIKSLYFDKLTEENGSLFALEKSVIKIFTDIIINFIVNSL